MRSCFNQLPNSKDWVKVFFLNNDSVLASFCADHRFNYREKGYFDGLDGGIIHAQNGMEKLNDPIVALVNESLCAAVIIICFMGGDSAHGLRNLINSIRTTGSPVYLISSIPFAAEGKRKRANFKECLNSVVDRLSGIYLLDLEKVIQHAVMSTTGQTLLEFFRFCDAVILDFFSIFVCELEEADKKERYIYSYDHLESELIVQKVSNIRDGLYALL
ncbi:hypothetical protein PBOR_03835 [Paenibacillus borealis]|uniref:Tubulin/FtsZ GTPase domain-containing protein n=1 Tax=Paenibacillus borealis TaxID=160799 RepID=A0A089L3W3_PAEBO|nr:hypothetical protein PBOR_03835 [Paenibacillus borealis]